MYTAERKLIIVVTEASTGKKKRIKFYFDAATEKESEEIFMNSFITLDRNFYNWR